MSFFRVHDHSLTTNEDYVQKTSQPNGKAILDFARVSGKVGQYA